MMHMNDWLKKTIILPTHHEDSATILREYVGKLIKDHLPWSIFEEYLLGGKIAIVSRPKESGATTVRDFQLTNRNVIVISRRLIPRKQLSSKEFVTYFLLIVFHEIAHVYHKHEPPSSKEDENQAYRTGLGWYNENADKQLTEDEMGELFQQWEGFWFHEHNDDWWHKYCSR